MIFATIDGSSFSRRSFSIFHILAIFLLGLLFAVTGTAEAANNNAKFASILVDAASGEVLQATAPDKQLYPASLTKMMTLFIIFDELDRGALRLDQRLKVSRKAAAQTPSKLGLLPGQTITVEDLILGLVTKSANDAAVVAAESIGGSEAQFATMMTNRARALGMSRTTFRNASGLPNRGQVSTARDMATLARMLIRKHGRYYTYFSTRTFTFGEQTIHSHNRLLARYEGADGIKTGYIGASGFNLVASAKRDGRRLIGVVFGGRSAKARDRHMVEMLDAGFERLAGKPAVIRTASVEDTAEDEGYDVSGIVGSGDAEDASWGIQVGAFGQAKAANRAIEGAAASLGALVAGAEGTVVPLPSGNRTLYRARLAGLSEDGAREACRRLTVRKGSCSVIAPDEGGQRNITRR